MNIEVLGSFFIPTFGGCYQQRTDKQRTFLRHSMFLVPLFDILKSFPTAVYSGLKFVEKGENNFVAIEKRLNLPPSFLYQNKNHEQS